MTLTSLHTFAMRSAAWFASISLAAVAVTAAGAGSVEKGRSSPARSRPSRAATIDRGWRRVVIDDQPALGSERYLMAAGSGGILVLGQGSASCCSSSIQTWFSRDGQVWRRGHEEGFFEPSEAADFDPSVDVIAGWKDGFIAVGRHYLHGSEDALPPAPTSWVWVAQGDASWTAEPGDPSFGEAQILESAVAHDRIVLAGVADSSSRTPRATTWTSVDAHDWRRPPDDGGPFTGFDRVHVAAAPQGFVAWANALADHHGTDPVLWSSLDGSTWEKLPTGDAFAGVALERIATVGSELLAVTTSGCTKRFLVSSDGRSWRSAREGGATAGDLTLRCATAIMAVAAGRARIVIGGGEYLLEWNSGAEQPALWFSPTGRGWQRIRVADLASTPWGPPTFAGIAAFGDGFVVAGGVPVEPQNFDAIAPAVWLWSGR